MTDSSAATATYLGPDFFNHSPETHVLLLMTSKIPLDEDFFPDWGTEAPRSISLSERINLPSSVVESSNLDHLYASVAASDPNTISHFLTSPSTYLTNQTPCLLFFYGTLSLPHILQRVLSLDRTPILLPASITGYTLKMWGPYPALIRPGHMRPSHISPSSSSDSHTNVLASVTAKVKSRLKKGSSSPVQADSRTTTPTGTVSGSTELIVGMAYWGTEEDIPKLLRHEGANYELAECVIRSGQDETAGRTFVWCGYPEELMEGEFDPTMFPDEARTLYGE